MSTTHISDLLKQTYLFSSSYAKELEEIVSKSHTHKYQNGEYLFWEGDSPEHFYILLKGRAKIIKHGSLGRETVVAFFGPCDIFGEVAVLENKPYPASCQAVEETEVLSINRQFFVEFLKRHPRIALAMIGILSTRLREAQSRLHDLSGERVEQRLARTLERLSSKIGDELPFTRQDLAAMSGTTMETTVRFLSRLKERKIITSHRGLVIIKDRQKLTLLADGPPQM